MKRLFAVVGAVLALCVALACMGCGTAGEAPAGESVDPEPSGTDAIVCPDDGLDVSIVPRISVEEAADMIAATPSLVILDVRTPVEFAEGHLEGAVNIDWESGHFAEDITVLDPTARYLVYCRTGIRAGYAAATMLQAGFTHVVNMAGGYEEWTFQMRPTVR